MSGQDSIRQRKKTWRGLLLESDLKATTKHVLLTLSMHLNEKGEGVFPSYKTLADECSRSVDTVKDHLRQARGTWIDWEPRFTEAGRQTSNRYELTTPQREGGEKHPPPSEHPPRGGEETPPSLTCEEGVKKGVCCSDLRSSREEEFLGGVRESPTTVTLTEGIHTFAWLAEEPPEQSPYQNGRRPEAIELSKLANWQGLERWKGADPEHYQEAALRLVGLRTLVEEGEVGHVKPGEPFCLGMAEPSREHAGQHLPTVALERGRRLQEPDEPDRKVADLMEEAARG